MTSIIVLDSSDEETEPTKAMTRPHLQPRPSLAHPPQQQPPQSRPAVAPLPQQKPLQQLPVLTLPLRQKPPQSRPDVSPHPSQQKHPQPRPDVCPYPPQQKPPQSRPAVSPHPPQQKPPQSQPDVSSHPPQQKHPQPRPDVSPPQQKPPQSRPAVSPHPPQQKTPQSRLDISPHPLQQQKPQQRPAVSPLSPQQKLPQLRPAASPFSLQQMPPQLRPAVSPLSPQQRPPQLRPAVYPLSPQQKPPQPRPAVAPLPPQQKSYQPRPTVAPLPLQQKSLPPHTKPQIIELPRKSPISIVRLDKLQHQQPPKSNSPNNSALATMSKRSDGVTITTVPACLKQTTFTSAFPPATISASLHRQDKPELSPGVFRIERPEATPSIFRLDKPETGSSIFRLEKPEASSGFFRLEKPEVSPGMFRMDKPEFSPEIFRMDKPEASLGIFRIDKSETNSGILRLDKPEANSGMFRIERPETSTAPATITITTSRNCNTPDKQEACSSKSSSRSSTPHTVASKRKVSESSDNGSEKSTKRIKPTQISDKVDKSWVASQSPVIAIDDDEQPTESDRTSDSIQNGGGPSSVCSSKDGATQEEEEALPVHPTYTALLDACRVADPSPDMETLIKTKLLRYYHSVHPDFVVSKGFCKTVKAVTKEIQDSPGLVYYKLKSVVEELKIRRKSKETVISNEETTTTGNERTDLQVKRLSKALYIVTKKIAKLEEADVDFDDDNSSYLQVERYKKRACEIYNMICDLTGESKHAHRSVKKPITFRGTSFPEFNRTLQSFVNRTKTFPDFYDVFRCLEHCNAQYCLGLKNDDIKSVAQDAFIKIGKLLQNRRKSDLYETVAHFTGLSADPAESDPSLNAKLHENQKHHTPISSVIEKYAKEQEVVATENKSKPAQKDGENKTPPKDTAGSSTEETNGKDKDITEVKEDIAESLAETVPKSSDDDPSKSVSSAAEVKSAPQESPTEAQPNKKAVDLPIVAEIVISDEES